MRFIIPREGCLARNMAWGGGPDRAARSAKGADTEGSLSFMRGHDAQRGTDS